MSPAAAKREVYLIVQIVATERCTDVPHLGEVFVVVRRTLFVFPLWSRDKEDLCAVCPTRFESAICVVDYSVSKLEKSAQMLKSHLCRNCPTPVTSSTAIRKQWSVKRIFSKTVISS